MAEPVPSKRFQRLDVALLGVNFAIGVLNAIGDALQGTGELIAAHINYQIDQSAFHEEAAMEIESLTSGTDEEE